MERRVVLLLAVYTLGVNGGVDHAELRGEHPKQEHIDNGQCTPVPCDFGVPPPECKKLCDSHSYQTICQKPADFCLCRHMVNGKWRLVSPDELDEEVLSEEIMRPSEKDKVVDQPPEKVESIDYPSEKAESIDHPSEKAESIDHPSEEAKVLYEPLQPSETEEQPSTKPDDGVVSFQIFAVFLPIKQMFYDSYNEADSTPEPGDFHALGYEPVNVHEGRLFWDFRYILTGLMLLMISLVVYELFMCAKQVYGPRPDLGQYEEPEVKVKIPITEKEKILNV
ncbi:uncharacterized protein LOC128993245 isoform X2 [Macrosteles quadrilineatus]|uniref:uncharacterized protein LOC128993245 isoform X2 n=1 Tax=Macrosteles quadrilineatus TaxID=74068 RepID=UPI0023E281C0|nr:uncharacterized protein LOC128993245 isoform X2 [Macrosteles quadrilineatus]